MSSGADELVFQCDYCGAFVPVTDAIAYYVPQRDLDDGRVLVITGVYCGDYCGKRATTWRSVG